MTKIFLLLFIFGFSFLVGCNQRQNESSDNYVGEKKDGKKHGIGKLIRGEKTFIGEFKNDVINGIGRYTSTFGDFYLGEWKNEKWYGTGTASWDEGVYSGDSCICQYENSVLNGFAKYFKKSGTIYTGFYKNGQPNGIGKIEFQEPTYEGDMYLGEILNGKMHGIGYYYDASSGKSGFIISKNNEVIKQDSTWNFKLKVDSIAFAIDENYLKLSQYLEKIKMKFELIENNKIFK